MGRKLLIIVGLFGCLLLVYTLLRLTFYHLYVDDTKNNSPFTMFLVGVQMDYASLFYANLLFLLYYFFIHNWLPPRAQVNTALILFLLLNLPLLAINFIDLAYFAFTGRRSTDELLHVLPDSIGSLPAFFKGYWYLFLSYVMVAAVLGIAAKKILHKQVVTKGKWQYILAIPVLLVLALTARGIGGRPVMPSTPLLYFDAEYQPLVTNSSFTFMYSVAKGRQRLNEKSYYSQQALDSLCPIRRQYQFDRPFQQKNVVIFILESFCKEYLQDGSKYRARTPFLDSLIAQSTWCSNAYANGTMSVQGIVSILASMPCFIHEPYFHSIYSNNKIRGIGTLLKEQGYTTNFFMGAGPDHFGFGKFCKIVGIDQYYSRKDFNNDSWYDGNWGIYDHQFLPYGARVLQKEQNPFMAVFFNISSHYPYSLPSDVGAQFDYKNNPAYVKTASYVDYSLRLFFDSIKNTPWYKNTIFVFFLPIILL